MIPHVRAKVCGDICDTFLLVISIVFLIFPIHSPAYSLLLLCHGCVLPTSYFDRNAHDYALGLFHIMYWWAQYVIIWIWELRTLLHRFHLPWELFSALTRGTMVFFTSTSESRANVRGTSLYDGYWRNTQWFFSPIYPANWQEARAHCESLGDTLPILGNGEVIHHK